MSCTENFTPEAKRKKKLYYLDNNGMETLDALWQTAFRANRSHLTVSPLGPAITLTSYTRVMVFLIIFIVYDYVFSIIKKIETLK